MLHHRLVTAYVYPHILHSEAGNVAPDVFGFTLASQSLEQAMRPEQAGGAAEESTRLRRGAEFNNGIRPTSVAGHAAARLHVIPVRPFVEAEAMIESRPAL